MLIDEYEFVADKVSKFYKYLYIYGWFHHKNDSLVSIEIESVDVLATDIRVGFNHGGVQDIFGDGKGFEVSVLRKSDGDLPDGSCLIFKTKSGKSIRADIIDLANDRISRYTTPVLYKEFRNKIERNGDISLLDIGGRSRSKIDRRKEFPTAKVTVLDIMDGENVDLVGDAHELSNYFEKNSIDAIYSSSVFEHLLMPWKVILEINKILKMGGVGFISTHQTIGMHDMPWDFWRFSDTSWDALLNSKTGFRIIDRAIDGEQFVIPYVHRQLGWKKEDSAGFEGSAVLFEKVGECNLEWPVKVPEIIPTMYPDTDDGN